MSTTDEHDDFEGDFRTAAEANARKAAELEEQLLEKLTAKLPTMDAKEASSALQAVANMKARNIEKLRAGDKPPVVPDDPAALLGSMVRRGYLKLSGPAAALGLEAAGEDEGTDS